MMNSRFVRPEGVAYLHGIAILLPVLATVVIALFLWRLSAAHEQLLADTLSQAGQRAAQLAEAKADQVESLLTGADIVVRQFRDQYAAGNLDTVRTTIESTSASFPKGAIVHFSAVDSEGYVRFSTLPVDGRIFVGDRDYFKFHTLHPFDELYINKPVALRSTNDWAVLLTRPILKGGRFAGVAVLSISPQFVSDALAKLKVAPDDVISLFFSDGTYLARSRDLSKVLGTKLPAERMAVLREAADHGTGRMVANADGRPRIYGWRRTQGSALILFVGLDEAAILAPANAEIRLANQRNLVAFRWSSRWSVRSRGCCTEALASRAAWCPARHCCTRPSNRPPTEFLSLIRTDAFWN
jgi:hypothetical protein